MNYVELFLTGAVGILAGYLSFLSILKILPKRLRAGNDFQRHDVLAEARKQAALIKADSVSRTQTNLQVLSEELEEMIRERHEDLKVTEADLTAQEQSIEAEENRANRAEQDLERHRAQLEEAQSIHTAKATELSTLHGELRQRLEQLSGSSAMQIRTYLRDQLVETRQLECQKVLRVQQEDLQSASKRLATRLMSRALARYAPEFPWPKAVNHVELLEPGLADLFAKDGGEGMQLIADMKQKAGIEIELVVSDRETVPPILKLGGGAGVDRESARLTLGELISRGGTSGWERSGAVFDKHRSLIDQQAMHLGKQAIKILELGNIHPEVQKLVGYLNWRTSYRQNQFLHSLEVAILAGLVASELGVDPDQAKRCGLLHDIGKALDYRIEGSHAVISGDYADRFGENRLICDTLMSHHNDLVVETPLAYVLKTADTLSGARPGARVNLEEGYQVRLSAIDDVIRSFPGVTKSAIMNGGREVHVEVNHKRIQEEELHNLSLAIAKKIQEDVAFPGQIKVLVMRRFEATAVA